MAAHTSDSGTNCWYKIFTFLAAAALLALNIVRIIKVPITFDEAASYEAPLTYSEIARLKIPSSNIHILNSLAIKFFTATFGSNIFWVRVDSLVAQIVFLWFSYLICKLLFKSAPWRICVFLLLNLWPLMFEFWGLARGYGLSIAFMLASVYFMLRYIQDNKIILLNLSLYFAVLAIYSHFTLLVYFCGLLCILIARHLARLSAKVQKGHVLMEVITVLIASAVLFLLVGGPVHKLMQAHEFYYGGNKDIVSDTVFTLIRENAFGTNPSLLTMRVITALAAIIPIVPGICWFKRWRQKTVDEDVYTGTILWLLLALPTVGIIAQHYLLHTLYPLDRVGLFFIPLYVLAVSYWLYSTSKKRQWAGRIVLYAATIVITANFISSANIKSSRLWWFGQNDLVVLDKIVHETQNKPTKNKLHLHWLFNPSFRYYINTSYSAYFEPVTDYRDCNAGVDTTYDYYYAARECLADIPKIYVADTSFCGDEFVLMRKK